MFLTHMQNDNSPTVLDRNPHKLAVISNSAHAPLHFYQGNPNSDHGSPSTFAVQLLIQRTWQSIERKKIQGTNITSEKKLCTLNMVYLHYNCFKT